MASLSYLQPQLEKIHGTAVVLDVPTPVIDSLRDLLHSELDPRIPCAPLIRGRSAQYTILIPSEHSPR